MITYDSEGRAFWNGERVARTTEVCSFLAPRSWDAGEYYKHKGTLIHRITEWDDTGELDESTVDPNLQGYLEAYRKFKKETSWRRLGAEIQFFHPVYKYCGRADRIGWFLRDRGKWNWVIDIKSGQPHKADLLQSPAYLFGLQAGQATIISIRKCGDLYLKSNGSYRFEEVKNVTAKFMTFLGGLKKWREEND
jgi:hypothetical protein